MKYKAAEETTKKIKTKYFSSTIYNPYFKKLPEDFDGFKIAHVSDLHNVNFKGKLEDEIAKQSPDIIVITGDFVHKENSYVYALNFAKNAVKIAPVFFVNGNHEARFKTYFKLRTLLREIGVTVLENEVSIISRNNSRIAIIGINDPNFFKTKGGRKKDEYKKRLLEICDSLDADFKILLTHRPEYFNFYAKCKIDLSFAGHAHGGQIRLPFFGAFFVLEQGFFPKYAAGLCKKDDKYMAVSRGLGQTWRTPPRIFNKREMVFVRLNKK